jgi:predicted RNase H-like nuclease
MGRYFYNPASLNDAIIYDYIPAGTPEAKEATRKPVDRLRDILLARKAA